MSEGDGWSLLKGKGESDEHFRLKLAAAAKLYGSQRYKVVAFECTVPGYDGVVDVIGIDPGQNRVAIVEVKVSRSDFLRDLNADDRKTRGTMRYWKLNDQYRKVLRERDNAEERVRDAVMDEHPSWCTVNTRGNRVWKRDRWHGWKMVREALAEDEEFSRLDEELKDVEDQRRKARKRATPTSMKLVDERLVSRVTQAYIMAPGGLIMPAEVPLAWGLMSPEKVIKRAPMRDVGAGDVMDALRQGAQRLNSMMLFGVLQARYDFSGNLVVPGLGK